MTRRNNFDFLRFFAALLVLYGHSHSITGVPVPGFAANAVGTIGVKIFFSISGYLVTASWLKDPNVGRYFTRRALRIFPALISVVFISVFFIGPALSTLSIVEYFTNARILRYLMNILLYISYDLPGVFMANIYPGVVNGSLWTIPAEVSMYILCPILSVALFGRRLLIPVTTAALCIGDLYFRHYKSVTGPIVFYDSDIFSWLDVCPYFLIGSCFFIFSFEKFLNIYVAFIGIMVLALFDTGTLAKEAMLMLILPYACLSFGVGSSVFSEIARIGDLSYGLFLYGWPIQQIFVFFIGAAGGARVNFALSASIASVVAFLSWRLVERPALKFKPKARVSVREIAVRETTSATAA